MTRLDCCYWPEINKQPLLILIQVLLDAPCLTDKLSANEESGNIFHPDFKTIRLDLPQTQTRMLV